MLEQGITTQSTKTNLKRLFELYLQECEYAKGLSLKTIKGYSEVFSIFQKLLPNVKDLKDLHPLLISQFFVLLKTRERVVGIDTIVTGVKSSTVRTYYAKLVVFFRWLENYGYIKEDSMSKKIIKPPRPKYVDSKSLSEHEISKIISSITLHSMNNSFLFKRDILIVSLLLYTGIRKGELLGLRVHDVNFETKSLFINGATSKSKKSRSIPLHYTLITHLKMYLEERKKRGSRCEFLLISSKNDTVLTSHGIIFWVRKYIRLSEVKFHLHRFRHTFACNLAKSNADIMSIMKVMGHSSIRMTERYLRSITPEDSREFINQLNY